MMLQLISTSLRLSMAIVIVAAPAGAQSARPSSDVQALSRGWAALAAGRTPDAVSAADAVLKRRPRSHAALSLKIEALSSGAQPLTALDAYEEWLARGGRSVEDRGLLEAVAAGILRALATDPDPDIRSRALQSLARAGDEAALQALKARSAAGDQTATVALAEEGDAGAIGALQTLVQSGTGRDMSAAIAALAGHGGVTPQLIETLSKDRVPMNRAVAAGALAARASPAAAQQLEELSRDPDSFVRRSVILARAKNGDRNAMAEARAMLASEVPDLRVMAANALQTALPRESEEAVRPLLTSPDGLLRFEAAAIVGRSDPQAVQSIVVEGLSHENPVIRQQAAHVAATALPGDLALLRQLLRHPDRAIVVTAAGAVIAALPSGAEK